MEQDASKGGKSFSRIRHPLFSGGWLAAARSRWSTAFVIACAGMVAGLTGFFSFSHGLGSLLVVLSLPPGFLLGMVLLGLERLLVPVKGWLLIRLGKLPACFLLFFIHLLGYMLLSSLLLSYPLGLLLALFGGAEADTLAVGYGLYCANVFMLAAFVSWLHNVRSLSV